MVVLVAVEAEDVENMSPVIPELDPKGGSGWEGMKAPGLRNTLLDFFRFFHFARRFWNQTWWKEGDGFSSVEVRKREREEGRERKRKEDGERKRELEHVKK